MTTRELRQELFKVEDQNARLDEDWTVEELRHRLSKIEEQDAPAPMWVVDVWNTFRLVGSN